MLKSTLLILKCLKRRFLSKLGWILEKSTFPSPEHNFWWKPTSSFHLDLQSFSNYVRKSRKCWFKWKSRSNLTLTSFELYHILKNSERYGFGTKSLHALFGQYLNCPRKNTKRCSFLPSDAFLVKRRISGGWERVSPWSKSWCILSKFSGGLSWTPGFYCPQPALPVL